MKNLRVRVITEKSGEIREFNVLSKKHFKKYMGYIRKECENHHKYFLLEDGFPIDYKINDILTTLLCDKKTYVNTNCIIERIPYVW